VLDCVLAGVGVAHTLVDVDRWRELMSSATLSSSHDHEK